MAAARPGRYREFHVRLMAVPGKLTEEAVLRIAGETGLDTERLRRDTQDPAIERYLRETRKLAAEIESRRTPSFAIGGKLVRGAVDGARMKEFVATARSGG